MNKQNKQTYREQINGCWMGGRLQGLGAKGEGMKYKLAVSK